MAVSEYLNFTYGAELMKESGMAYTILPFLLIFAIVYGALLTIKVFGENEKKVPGLIAVAFAFFLTAATDVGMAIANFVAHGSGMLVIGLLIIILLALFGIKLNDKDGGGLLTRWIFLIIFTLMVWTAASTPFNGAPSLLSTAGLADFPTPWSILSSVGVSVGSEELSGILPLLVMLIVVIVVVWLVTRESNPNGGHGGGDGKYEKWLKI